MNTDDERFLKAAKEVLVKFIEMGTVSPSNFDERISGASTGRSRTRFLAPGWRTWISASPPEEKPPEK